MLITFDFDNTITQTAPGTRKVEVNGPVASMMRYHHDRGDEVRVVTTRGPGPAVVDALDAFGLLGLVSGIHHTSGRKKGPWLAEAGILPAYHYDDNPAELPGLPDGVVGLLVPVSGEWEAFNAEHGDRRSVSD